MNKESKILQQRSDEVELRELLLVLWKGKLVIFVVSIIFVTFGLLYVIFFQTETAKISIRPIPFYAMGNYDEINYLLQQLELDNITPDQQRKYLEEKKEPAITAQSLVNLLMERVRKREDLVKAAEEIQFIPQRNRSKKELEQLINEFVYDIQFLIPMSHDELAKNKLSNERFYWQIQTEGVKDRFLYKQLLELSLKNSNEFIRVALMDLIGQKIIFAKLIQKQKLEDIDLKINSLREDYKVKTTHRIAYLKEQAQIARKLGIAKSTIETQTFGSSNLVATLQTESQLYLKGFEAIEEELLLLQNRASIDEFIPEIIKLQQTRRMILGSKKIERIIEALENSQLNNSELFQSAMVDLDGIKYERKPNSIILLFIMVFLGAGLGSIIVLINNFIFRTSDYREK